MVQQPYEDLREICIDDCLNRWRVLYRQQLPYSNQTQQLCGLIIVKDELTQNVEVLQIELHFVGHVTRERLDVDLVLLLELQRLLNCHGLRIDLTEVYLTVSSCGLTRAICRISICHRLLSLNLTPFLFHHFLSIKINQ
jgi:hypothetical protein